MRWGKSFVYETETKWVSIRAFLLYGVLFLLFYYVLFVEMLFSLFYISAQTYFHLFIISNIVNLSSSITNSCNSHQIHKYIMFSTCLYSCWMSLTCGHQVFILLRKVLCKFMERHFLAIFYLTPISILLISLDTQTFL